MVNHYKRNLEHLPFLNAHSHAYLLHYSRQERMISDYCEQVLHSVHAEFQFPTHSIWFLGDWEMLLP